MSSRHLFVAALFATSPLVAAPAIAADLLDVYRLAQQNDAAYQAAGYQLDAAKAGVPLARSALMPQAAASANLALNENNNDRSGSYASDSIALSLTQPLYNRGSSQQLDQAQLGVSQAEADFASADQDLILRVAERYFDVLRTLDSLQFAQSEKEAIARQLDQAERRFEVGLIAITDVKEAQAQYDLAIAQEIAAENAVATAREALYVTTGERVQELQALQENTPLESPAPHDIESWVKTAEENNLPLAAARIAAQVAAQQVQINRASRYPTIDLVAAYSDNGSDGPMGDTEGGQVKVELKVPLYTGGATTASVRQARASAAQAQQLAELQRRGTVQQARSAYLSLQADISRVKALKQALVSTQVAADATQAGFEVGTRTAVEVLAALRNTYRSQADYRSARYDYLLDRLRLQQAAGTLSADELATINAWLQP